MKLKTSIRPSLNVMINNLNRLGEMMGNDLVSCSQEYLDAMEQLKSLELMGKNLMSTFNFLETSRKSLESLGYSDEWLNAMNYNGKLLDTINVDIDKLVGDNAHKAEVCMEGLLGTIWEWIKRIWGWIVDAFKKLVVYFKRIFAIYRMKGLNQEEKLLALCAALSNADDLVTHLRKIGEAVNRAGGRGTKAMDARQLIERASVARVICAYFINSINPVFGIKNVDKNSVTDRDIVSDKFVESIARGVIPENPILTKLKYDLSNDQMNICVVAQTRTEGFKNGFVGMANPEGFSAMMKKAGFKIVDGSGAGAFIIDPLEDVIDDIDYTKTFTTLDSYNYVFGAAMHVATEGAGIVNRAATDTEVYLDKVKDCINVVMQDLKTVVICTNNKAPIPNFVKHIVLPYNPAVGAALNHQSRMVAETTAIILKFSQEMVNTLNKVTVLREAILAVKP